MLWRFWPQRDRLPFMDIHQSGHRNDRLLYTASMSDPRVWPRMAARYGFDVALIRRVHARGDQLLNILDADSTWAMVFVDDVAALYVRREGRDRALVGDHAYHVLPGGQAKMAGLETKLGDAGTRSAFRGELARAVAESDANSSVRSVLATLDLVEGRADSSRVQLELAHAIDPLLPLYHYRLGAAERSLGHAREALDAFRRARSSGEVATVDAETAPLLEQLGRRAEAHAAYDRAARADPANPQLRAGSERTAGSH
jgi:tetratricopeptide (TPR) repeat protein